MVGPGSPFHVADWCIFAGYGLALALGGVLARRRARDARDFFVGHGQMPSWAVAISVLASALSVASYLGVPEAAYSSDLTYLISNVGTVIAVVIVAWFFIPRYYHFQVVTVYELIGNRFGPRAKLAASLTFLLGRMLASGVRLFMAAIPAAAILFGGAQADLPSLILGVAVLTVVATLYTLSGGITSIIWTDVVQLGVAMGAVLAVAVVIYCRIPLHLGAMVHLLTSAGDAGGSKLRVVNTSTDPHVVNTIWTALSGYLLLNLAVYGTDQDLAQRMLTCKNALAGGRSALLSIVMNLPITLLFMCIGLLLYVFYHLDPQQSHVHHPLQSGEHAFISFILYEQPPGMAGLLMAGLFAIAFTSLLSAINAMAAALVNDCYRPLRPGVSAGQLLRASRLAVVASGLVIGLVAVGCIFWQHATPQIPLLDFAFTVVVVPYCGMLGIFLTAIFTTRGNGLSACLALAAGMVSILILQRLPFTLHADGPQAVSHALAWPWQMVVGTSISTAICCCGRRPRPPMPGSPPS